MKFLILSIYDPPFLDHLYATRPGLELQPYEQQLQAHTTDSCFFTSDFYSANLRALGHEAQDVVFNSWQMQLRWAKEFAPSLYRSSTLRERLRGPVTGFHRRIERIVDGGVASLTRKAATRCGRTRALHEILLAQVKHWQPDVLLNIAMAYLEPTFLTTLKPYVRLLAGQLAWVFPQDWDYRCYDLFLSSLPNFVDEFRSKGVASEFFRLGFEPRILTQLRNEDKPIPVCFVGTFTHAHSKGTQLLESICTDLPLRLWGPGIESLPQSSPLRKYHQGQVWAIQTYQTIRNSLIVLNRHADFTGRYANNIRLYETTGVGSLLVTDFKHNLHDLFDIGKEVVAYRSPKECVELIQHYLAHPDEAAQIASAGQQRTLREHTYHYRMQELTEIISRYV